jgi:1,4-dihydroxy-2-naphthoyl-CoA hydrolase
MSTTERTDKGQPLANLLGVEIVEATKERVVGRLLVREDLCTGWHTIHGGTVMAFADTLGATGAWLNLPEGASTTTIESKTNFIAPAKVGTVVTAESLPIHIGRRSSVWQTRITRDDGKLVAIVTQTQMVL